MLVIEHVWFKNVESLNSQGELFSNLLENEKVLTRTLIDEYDRLQQFVCQLEN